MVYLLYALLWALSGVFIQFFYIWYNWLNWRRPGIYLFGALFGPVMLIIVIIASRYE